jgi:hypothetical protein
VLEFVQSEADVPKGHERVGSMNVGLRGSTTPKISGQGGSAAGSGNPDDGVGTSSGVLRVQGAGGISPGVVTPKQMTYVVGSQSQVPRSPSRFHHSILPGGGGSTGSGEGGYPNTPGKEVRLSPLIDSDDEDALRRVVEGIGSSRGAPGPSGGGGEPSSRTKMRIDFGKQPCSEPPILKETEIYFDGLTGPLVTNQGENSAAMERTFQRRIQHGQTVSAPEGVGWQPILGQDFANAPHPPPMERGPGPFGIQSLASLGVHLASIGGLPPLPGRDGLHTSVSTQHSADAVMQTVPDPELRAGRQSKSGPSLPGAKRKRSKTSKSVGSAAGADALEAGLDLVDAGMCAERLSPSAYERSKKARVERISRLSFAWIIFRYVLSGVQFSRVSASTP